MFESYSIYSFRRIDENMCTFTFYHLKISTHCIFQYFLHTLYIYLYIFLYLDIQTYTHIYTFLSLHTHRTHKNFNNSPLCNTMPSIPPKRFFFIFATCLRIPNQHLNCVAILRTYTHTHTHTHPCESYR